MKKSPSPKKIKPDAVAQPLTGAFGNFFDIEMIVFVIFVVSVLYGGQLEARGMPHAIAMAGRLSLFVFCGAVMIGMGVDTARQSGAIGWVAQTRWLIKRVLWAIGIGLLFIIGIVLFVAIALHFR